MDLTSEQVANLTSMTYVSVNAWTRRYEEEGIEGLKIKPGRGRKAVLEVKVDQESVKANCEGKPATYSNCQSSLGTGNE